MATKDDIQQLARVIGQRVQTRRKALGLTQERLGEQADLSPTFIAKIEAGVKTPSLGTLIDIAAALDLDPGDLLRRREKQMASERARNLADSFDGLNDEDTAFAEQELLHLVAYLRRRA